MSKWVEIFPEGSIYNGVEIVFEATQINNAIIIASLSGRGIIDNSDFFKSTFALHLILMTKVLMLDMR